VPPSIRASLPALPSSLDRDPEPLGQLSDGDMGALVLDNANISLKYGVLGVRYNTLRQFYSCVREAVNNQAEAKDCMR
jgi:hypothetical protein